jgi:NADH-quinone oxidoreductase subunit C
LSSADEGDQQHPAEAGPPAEEVTEPALAAEVDDPAASNVPTGEESTPGGGVSAADREPLPAPGAPEELSSDQTPAQGGERGTTVPAEELAEVAGGDAGAPESVSPSGTGAAPAPFEPVAPDDRGAAAPPVERPPGESGPAGTAGAAPSGGASAVVPEQPPATPGAVAAEGAAVERSTEEKVAEAVAAREAVVDAAQEEAERRGADDDREALVETLRRVLGEDVVDAHVRPGTDAWVRVPVEAWRRAAEVCRETLGLTYFCYLSAIDWLPSPYGRSEDPAPGDPPGATASGATESGDDGAGDDGAGGDGAGGRVTPLEHGYAGGDTRFQLLARLVSPTTHLGLTLKADLAEPELRAPSLIEVFPGADWHEREVWEMYGVDFEGHPNLVHLYLPGGFEGHPLRKDFPLLAREVKPWPGLVDVEAMPGEESS